MNNIAHLFLALLLTSACQSRNSPQEIEVSGTVEMTEHTVGARTAGRISELLFEEGEAVQKGQILAKLDRAEQAERDLQRVKNIFRNGGATEQAVEQAQLAYEDQIVRSPVSGLVLVQVHERGDVVSAGATIAIVGDESNRWVRVYVPEGQINRVKPNQKVTIQFDGLEHSITGTVGHVAPKAEFTPRNVQTPEERILQVFAVKIKLPTDATLRPGVSADVILPLEP